MKPGDEAWFILVCGKLTTMAREVVCLGFSSSRYLTGT